MNKVELLAPAGDLERLKFSFLYGADACYIGGLDYSLRANAQNFSLDQIKEACLFAHKLNKKVYVTVNIIFHNEDTQNLEEYLKNLEICGVDGIYNQDISKNTILIEIGGVDNNITEVFNTLEVLSKAICELIGDNNE